MKNDVLERLLIDRAAGELPRDVEVLLESHLEREPAARTDALEIEETLRLARLVLTEQPVVTPLPSQKTPKWVWAMAACFACGLLLGMLVVRERNVQPMVGVAAISRSAVTTASEQSNFWSIQHFQGASSATAKLPNHVVWASVFKKPEILQKNL